jgi:ATP-dependent Clp protease ATP-binding subunit ClpA
MLERFTTSARTAVIQAKREALALRHNRIGTEHLLLAMLAGTDGFAAGVLRDIGVSYERIRAAVERVTKPGGLSAADAAALEAIGIDLDAVRAKLEESFGPGALTPAEPPPRRGLFRRSDHGRPARFPLSPRGRKVMGLALREAVRLKQPFIGTEHILLAILRDGGGIAVAVLRGEGVDLADLRARTEAATAAAA